MMTEFTPMLSVSGGRLIVLSAVAVFIFLDGFSGYRELLPARSILILANSWRAFSLIGLVGSPVVLSMVSPSPHGFEIMGLIPMLIGGFLVGYGTRVGSGCTSGHGI